MCEQNFFPTKVMVSSCISNTVIPDDTTNIRTISHLNPSPPNQEKLDSQTTSTDPLPIQAKTNSDGNIKKSPTAEKKRVVSKIKKNRRKHGEEQLLVIYSHEKSEKGHWVARASLDCNDLIEEYFENIKAQSPKKSTTREIEEILGIVPKNGKISSFEIRYKDSGKIGYISAATMRKRYCDQLLSFYEEHIQPEHTPEISENAT